MINLNLNIHALIPELVFTFVSMFVLLFGASINKTLFGNYPGNFGRKSSVALVAITSGEDRGT